jgi:NADH dehydrogenase
VVIVGAGFGGLAAAKALADAPVDVTVVDQRNHHTFQPLLYQVATAGLGVDDICYATRGIFHRQSNARALQGRMVGVDLDARLVQLADGEPLPYDHLILALGAVTADFGVPGVAEHAFGLKNAEEARRIRTHVLQRFEAAERLDDPRERAAAMTIVVAGGGPTGVEMAGGFVELFDHVLRRDFDALDIGEARVVLVEGQDEVLGAFSEKLGRKARARLEKMGVEVRTGVNVERYVPGEVTLADATSIPTDTLVWAAGVRAHPLAERLGLETTRGGRVVVDEHLRLPGHPQVFVVGDLAATTLNDGSPVPQVAAAAIQGGRHAAALIEATERRATIDPFRYRNKGSMATIGRNAAVVELPSGLRMSGFPGWVAWLALHLVMLIGFRNRANVLVNWAWNYLTYDRGSRLIIEPDPPLDPS